MRKSSLLIPFPSTLPLFCSALLFFSSSYLFLRSIGDLLIKDLKNQHFDMEFTGDLVLAEPEVTTTKLEPETDRFVVAATDGLWDVMTSQEVTSSSHYFFLPHVSLLASCQSSLLFSSYVIN